MTSRDLVLQALKFNYPERVPRDLWALPISMETYPVQINNIQKKYPLDIKSPFSVGSMKGEMFKRGTYTDEWGCTFEKILDGLGGEVKNPLVLNLADLKKIKPPYETMAKVIDNVDIDKEDNKFVLGGYVNLFERMQFLRGTQNLFMDIAECRHELFELRDFVHQYNLSLIRKWMKKDIDGILISDDWGSQVSLLISPKLWRELFKTCYAEYCEIARSNDKFVFMHSDGYIFNILRDLIDIGINAINSQLFCMNIEEIGKEFKGKIAFWGEIDRQYILTSSNLNEVRDAVKRVKKSLYDVRGGIIAQCEFSAGSRPENVETVFKEWKDIE